MDARTLLAIIATFGALTTPINVWVLLPLALYLLLWVRERDAGRGDVVERQTELPSPVLPHRPTPLRGTAGEFGAYRAAQVFEQPLAVYVAGCLERWNEALCVANILRGRGVVVVSTWHDGVRTTRAHDQQLPHSVRCEISERCKAEVAAADVLLLLADDRGRGSVGEALYAMALQRTVVAVGDPQSVTTMLAPATWLADVDALWGWIERETQGGRRWVHAPNVGTPEEGGMCP